MPKTIDLPPALRPFVFHGVDLLVPEHGEEAQAVCPFCSHESRKCHINLTSGEWHCKTCPESGNAATFLRKLWEYSYEETKDYSELARHRGLLDDNTPLFWNVCCSRLTGDWLVPAYGQGGKLDQLYHYGPVFGGSKWILSCTNPVESHCFSS